MIEPLQSKEREHDIEVKPTSSSKMICGRNTCVSIHGSIGWDVV